MSPEPQQPNSENTNAENAFVQQALAEADRSRTHLSHYRWRARHPRPWSRLSGWHVTCSHRRPGRTPALILRVDPLLWCSCSPSPCTFVRSRTKAPALFFGRSPTPGNVELQIPQRTPLLFLPPHFFRPEAVERAIVETECKPVRCDAEPEK